MGSLTKVIIITHERSYMVFYVMRTSHEMKRDYFHSVGYRDWKVSERQTVPWIHRFRNTAERIRKVSNSV